MIAPASPRRAVSVGPRRPDPKMVMAASTGSPWSGGGARDVREEERGASLELGGHGPEGGPALAGAGDRGGVRDAPVDGPGVPREVGADLADLVAEADHPVEALPDELVEVLRLVE